MHAPAPTRLVPLAVLLVGGVAAEAGAVALGAAAEERVAAGLVVRTYRTANPTTDTRVVLVDLCAAHVSVLATEASDATQTTGAWGDAAGAHLAVNGDFFKTGPLHVYGDAVGSGNRWPRAQTGNDPAYQDEWYWHHAGFIAFGHDWVDFSHTGRVKNRDPQAVEGWSPGAIVDTLPAGVLSLVGGFPELVTEGRTVACDDPTADACFPDRSDMRARHPRTAMGLSRDRRTFLLVQVDGRTNRSAGMYGTELADVMNQLGAWQAFNLDGGGSSQLWVRGRGYLNDVDGNNSGAGTRAVANHWGIRVSADDPVRPAHCVDSPPCGLIPAAGGVVDDAGACFRTFGPSRFWRVEESAGAEGGTLHWTNAFRGSTPDNWAWWQLDLAEAGTYRVEVRGSAAFGLFDRADYVVVADGQETHVVVDQGAQDAWLDLGEFAFAAGGRQFVRVNDNSAAAVAADTHVVADAVRLTRVEIRPPDADASVSRPDAADPGPEGDAAAPEAGSSDAQAPQANREAGASPDGGGQPGADAGAHPARGDAGGPAGGGADGWGRVPAPDAQSGLDGGPRRGGDAARLQGGCATAGSSSSDGAPWLLLWALVRRRRR